MTASRPRLVVLGAGFAAFSLIKRIDVKRFDVTVVSPRNHFLFSPLLPSTTVGTIEFRSIIEPVRTARRGIRYYQAECMRIDAASSTVHCEGVFKRTPFALEYDYLAVGVGGISNTFGVPGVEEHAFFLKELGDARAIRQRVLECFERAQKPGRPEQDLDWLLHFVVVGGGPTGIEFAAELHDFIREDLSRWYPDLAPHAKITVIEATDEILTTFDRRLSAYAMKHFKRNAINIRTKSQVTEVREESVLLTNGEEVECGLTVWSTGIGPTQLLEEFAAPKDRRSRLVTDRFLLVRGTANVYGLGDCAMIEEADLPPTAQVAQQKGKYLAKALNDLVRGKPVKPFVYKHIGMLAYVGGRKALADLKNVKGRGFSTWLFWRSAYLTKLVSGRNKFLVLSDWIRASIFGRDISRF